MSFLLRPRALVLGLLLGLFVTGASADPAYWKKEIDTLTHSDAEHPPAKHGIVFAGSSSIRFWTSLQQDFPGLPVIRRGFGGSELADSVFYFDRIVGAYEPRTVVLYAGENDIHAGVSPEKVAADFNDFRLKLHATLPETRLIFIALKPSPSRWADHEKAQRANALIATACAHDPLLTFLDIYPAMLGLDGNPRPELFRDDLLHMKPAGYAIWVRMLTPLLKP
ncbi:MAG: SGNH/GDSL hydrolase family protein [Lacunisphaera sp.]